MGDRGPCHFFENQSPAGSLATDLQIRGQLKASPGSAAAQELGFAEPVPGGAAQVQSNYALGHPSRSSFSASLLKPYGLTALENVHVKTRGKSEFLVTFWVFFIFFTKVA